MEVTHTVREATLVNDHGTSIDCGADQEQVAKAKAKAKALCADLKSAKSQAASAEQELKSIKARFKAWRTRHRDNEICTEWDNAVKVCSTPPPTERPDPTRLLACRTCPTDRPSLIYFKTCHIR